MKKVFSSNPQLCHKFNEQSQAEGRASNMFFEGDTIYSYGRHYILGEFLTPDLIVINDVGYSSSTSKHISILTSATRDKTQIFTMRAEPQKVANQIEANFSKLAHARKPEKYISEIIYLYEGFVKSCNKLGGVLHTNRFDGSYSVKPLEEKNVHIDYMREIYEGFNTKEQAERLAKIKKEDKVARERQREIRKKQAEREQQRKAEQVEKFYNYETNYVSGLENELLRLSNCGNYIETSQRAEIPLNEAQRYYKILKSGANMRGQKIAQYITKSFDEVLQIGCHKIDKQEAQRIGELILNL
jgi:hypothetical protein